MKTYTHESSELNALLGKLAKITFFDGQIVAGRVERDRWSKNKYSIKNSTTYTFYKSHVKKIEKI